MTRLHKPVLKGGIRETGVGALPPGFGAGGFLTGRVSVCVDNCEMNPEHKGSLERPESSPPYQLDKRSLRGYFQRCARGYDRNARVAEELGARLLEHLEPVRMEPERVLDLGAGTGNLARKLARRYRKSRVLALDLSESMLAVARAKRRRLFSRQQFVCGDGEKLPLKSACVQLVLSNATLQCCTRPDAVFAEVLRVLAPGGLFMFSTLGPDTLVELRTSFARVDDLPHVHAFMDMHDLGDALVRAGFADVVLDSARLTAEYQSVEELLRELKATGASNAISQRRRGLTARGKLERLAGAYEDQRRNGLLPATFEAVFAHAWKPAAGELAGIDVAPPHR